MKGFAIRQSDLYEPLDHEPSRREVKRRLRDYAVSAAGSVNGRPYRPEHDENVFNVGNSGLMV
jgi:hypothetical protein